MNYRIRIIKTKWKSPNFFVQNPIAINGRGLGYSIQVGAVGDGGVRGGFGHFGFLKSSAEIWRIVETGRSGRHSAFEFVFVAAKQFVNFFSQ